MIPFCEKVAQEILTEFVTPSAVKNYWNDAVDEDEIPEWRMTDDPIRASVDSEILTREHLIATIKVRINGSCIEPTVRSVAHKASKRAVDNILSILRQSENGFTECPRLLIGGVVIEHNGYWAWDVKVSFLLDSVAEIR